MKHYGITIARDAEPAITLVQHMRYQECKDALDILAKAHGVPWGEHENDQAFPELRVVIAAPNNADFFDITYSIVETT